MKRYSSNLAFVDMLFNLLIGFTSLFIIAFLLINPTAEEGKVTPITEFIITAAWDPDSPIDIDLWVRGPGPDDRFTTVGYQGKDGRYMVLERDDLGITNDVYTVNGEQLVVARNIETLTINAIVPGEYVVAIHFFGPNNEKNLTHVEEVEVIVTEMNPYRIIYGEKKLLKFRQEISFVSFVVDKDGRVTDIRTDIDIKVRPPNTRYEAGTGPVAPATYDYVPNDTLGQ